jgi:fucose 4-O-acetylase-like acetyltransferase
MTTALAPNPTSSVSVADLAALTPSSRNRAIDAYRAIAMVAVAVGHWLAADARMVDGKIVGGNALDRMSQFHLLTWVFQVMPLFFCIGGYANAASLDAHRRSGGHDSVWVRARLLRLSTPSSWLAGTWLAVLIGASLLGIGDLAQTALAVAAIPLWFLCNYVIDTALAPRTLTLYRRYRLRFVGALMMLFSVGEAARFAGVHFVPQINIVIGWLLFQVLGFAWKDGHLPAGSRLVAVGVASWAAAGAMVALGPWPLAMVSVPGARFANTWPPSLALLAYGLGACSFAIAAAPRVDRFLSRHRKVWSTVIVANTMTMTSYLWHFTALSVAVFGLSQVDMLPTASVGTAAWWLQKVPVMGCALVVLAGIIAVLSAKERQGLVSMTSSERPASSVSGGATAALAVALAASFELWTASSGSLRFALPGMIMMLGVHIILRNAARK